MSACLLTGCLNDATGSIVVETPPTGFDQRSDHASIPVCSDHLRLSGATITGLTLGQPPEVLVMRMSSIVPGDLIFIDEDFLEVLRVNAGSLYLKPKSGSGIIEYAPPMGGYSFVPRKRRPGE